MFSMRLFFLILLMIWAAMLFILVMSWGLLLFGANTGDFAIFLPIMFAIAGVALLSRSNWFAENIRKPLADTLECDNIIERIIRLQLFTIICGVMGLGLGIAAMTSFYPMGIKLMLRGLAAGNEEWHNFTKYTPMSLLSGCSFGILFYSYLFADARKNIGMTRAILIGGFIGLLLLGLLFGDDRYFVVTQDGTSCQRYQVMENTSAHRMTACP